jgi:hypothetical protein
MGNSLRSIFKRLKYIYIFDIGGSHNMGQTIIYNKTILTTLYAAIFLLAVMMPFASASSPPPMMDGCAMSVAHLEATCAGGDIVTDNYAGSCRQVICETEGASMKALACDKPGLPIPEYYEVYRQSVEGSGISEICLGDACVGTRGFALGDSFPICNGVSEAYCGDGIVNQDWEECDGYAGVPPGYYCTQDCELRPIHDDEVCVIDHRTQTQGGWGTSDHGDNPGAYRDANFDGAFPDGVMIGIEGEWRALFETSSDVEAFLPQGGEAAPLGQNYLNPLTTDAGVLAGQALSLKLSLGFDAYDPDFSGSDTPLSVLVLNTGYCEGMSVQQVMHEADLVLAGMGTFTPYEINECLDLINNNFVDGTTDRGYLECPPKDVPPVDPACPLDKRHYDHVIEIFERIRTDRGFEDSVTSKYPVSLMPGKYKVTLVADDGHERREYQIQPHEQYALEFFKSSNSVGVTRATSDLEDEVEYARVIETVETAFHLPDGADHIRGVHAYYPHENPNSLNVVCVGLKEEKEVDKLSCEDAIRYGLLTGSIDGNDAVVHNNANVPFDVSLVSYKMPSGRIEDQILYDVDTKVVYPKSSEELSVDTPDCMYQIDLICGPVLHSHPDYADRLIDSRFGNIGDYCKIKGDGTAKLSIAPWFPKDKSYVFICETDFEATSYDWYFGDGNHLLNIHNDNVWHTFHDYGMYHVTCVATDGVQEASDSMLVQVGEAYV